MNPERFRPPNWLRWAGVAVVAVGILYASVLDSPGGGGLAPLGPLGVFGLDKWLHAVAYAALAGALAVALAPDRSPAVAAGLAALLAVGYGVALEFVQAPLPARYFSVADMAADAVGAGLAVLLWRAAVGFVGRSSASSTSEPEA